MAEVTDITPEQFLALEKDSIIPLVPAEVKPEGYDPYLVAVASAMSGIMYVRSAMLVAPQAQSWRGYNVGAYVQAVDYEIVEWGILLA